jgi:hypothetical protein
MLHGYEISKLGYLLIYRFNLIDLLALEDKLMYAFTLYNVTTVLCCLYGTSNLSHQEDVEWIVVVRKCVHQVGGAGLEPRTASPLFSLG